MSLPGLVGDRAHASGRASGRARWLQGAKLAVTIGILAFLLSRVDLRTLADAIVRSFGGWLALALVANSLLLITSTWKWDRLLRAVGVTQRFGTLLRLYTIGFFFSSFLPGTVGGDVVRWHGASSAPALRARIAATILAERLTGAMALVGLCVLLLAWHRERLATGPVLIVLGGLVAAVVAGLWLAWNPRLAKLLLRASRGRTASIARPLHELHRALIGFPTRVLVASVGYSAPFYAAAGLVYFLVCRAFGVELGLLEATAVQVLISLLTMLPISLGGLGLAQAGDVYLLGLLGVEAPTALGLSLLRQVIRYAYAGLGALLFLGWSGHPSVSELRSLAGAPPPGEPGDGAK